MSGLDVDIFADGLNLGDMVTEAVFNQIGDGDGEESLPRKLYNYFFASKDKLCTKKFYVKYFLKLSLYIRSNIKLFC